MTSLIFLWCISLSSPKISAFFSAPGVVGPLKQFVQLVNLAQVDVNRGIQQEKPMETVKNMDALVDVTICQYHAEWHNASFSSVSWDWTQESHRNCTHSRMQGPWSVRTWIIPGAPSVILFRLLWPWSLSPFPDLLAPWLQVLVGSMIFQQLPHGSSNCSNNQLGQKRWFAPRGRNPAWGGLGSRALRLPSLRGLSLRLLDRCGLTFRFCFNRSRAAAALSAFDDPTAAFLRPNSS